MIHGRLHPPMSALRSVEAAVRLGSFTAAAEELGVSQSAVSQAVRQLERQLDVILFERAAGSAAPTEAAHSYATQIRSALDVIRSASQQLMLGSPRELSIGCLRGLLNTWLIRRLPLFLKANPQVQIRVVALDRGNDGAAYDVAIGMSPTALPPPGAETLCHERLIPVATATFAAELGDVLERSDHVPCLLGSGWDQWRLQYGPPPGAAGSLRLRETSAALAAARDGLGVALSPDLLCTDDLVEGRLVRVSNQRVDRGRTYWVRAKASGSEASLAFCDWLHRAVAQAMDQDVHKTPPAGAQIGSERARPADRLTLDA